MKMLCAAFNLVFQCIVLAAVFDFFHVLQGISLSFSIILTFLMFFCPVPYLREVLGFLAATKVWLFSTPIAAVFFGWPLILLVFCAVIVYLDESPQSKAN